MEKKQDIEIVLSEKEREFYEYVFQKFASEDSGEKVTELKPQLYRS